MELEDKFLLGPDLWKQKLRDVLKHHFDPPGHPPIVTAAAIASANKLIKDPNVIAEWLTHARDLKAVEMELPGVYEAARSTFGDRPVLAIRGISDIVGFKRHAKWTKYACQTAASLTYALLRTGPISPRSGLGSSLPPESTKIVANFKHLQADLSSVLADRNGPARWKGIRGLIDRYKAIRPVTSEVAKCLARINRAAASESRSIGQASSFWDDAMKNVLEAYRAEKAMSIQKIEILHLFSEYAVDYSQSGLTIGVELNKLSKSLRDADEELGQHIFKMDRSAATDEQIYSRTALLSQRSKANRAIATLLRKRGGAGSANAQQAEIDKRRKKSLRYAEEAVGGSTDQACRFERVLSWFANSNRTDDPMAEAGVDELRALVAEGYSTPAGYELCKQLNFRHLYPEVIEVFSGAFASDKNHRRAYENVKSFAWAVKGLNDSCQSDKSLRPNVEAGATKAKMWLEECISCEYHTAFDLVLLAYMRSILGEDSGASIEALSGLYPAGGGIWNELISLADEKDYSANAKDGLLLGLNDPQVWNLIGTYLKTWTNRHELAIDYYERARTIDPRHPMYSLNKALTFAGISKWKEADRALKECDARRHHRYAWYKANQASIDALRYEIERSKEAGAFV